MEERWGGVFAPIAPAGCCDLAGRNGAGSKAGSILQRNQGGNKQDCPPRGPGDPPPPAPPHPALLPSSAEMLSEDPDPGLGGRKEGPGYPGQARGVSGAPAAGGGLEQPKALPVGGAKPAAMTEGRKRQHLQINEAEAVISAGSAGGVPGWAAGRQVRGSRSPALPALGAGCWLVPGRPQSGGEAC